MFCDIYSLGRGVVFSREQFCCFSINHLQVRRGYRHEKIPKVVLEQACGTLGKWKRGGDPPKLEIVHHHEPAVVWPKIPERWRSPAIQSSGTARILVPVTNPIEKALYPAGIEAYTLEMRPLKARHSIPTLEDLLPGLIDQVRTPALSKRPQEAPAEQMAGELSTRPSLLADGQCRPSKDTAERPPGLCRGSTGSGAPCPRKARPGASYCGAHGHRVAS